MLAASPSRADKATEMRRRWWCFDNPFGGVFAVALYGNEIVATCYLGGKTLTVGGKEIVGYEIGETATAPSHQRRGLFSKLVRACNEYAKTKDAKVVYGTPNRQSTPGYAKLGLDITDDTASKLFAIPSVSHFLKLSLPNALRCSSPAATSEIEFDEYAKKTRSFARLNSSSEKYLKWRFHENNFNYRFFRYEKIQEIFYCAARPGVIGGYPIWIISEYFLNGLRSEPYITSKYLKIISSMHLDMKCFAGIYFHAIDQRDRSFFSDALRRIIKHRNLPVCATGENSRIKWFENFQLSDCDIG